MIAPSMGEPFTITLPPEMLRAVEVLAERDGKSVSDFILEVFAECIEDARDISAADSAHLRFMENQESFSRDEVRERYFL